MKNSWTNHRLKKSNDFQRVINKRKKIFRENFVIFYSKINKKNVKKYEKKCRFGISIPQKIVKKSHLRNKYKRQVRSIITEFIRKKNNFINELKEWDFVIVIKEKYLSFNFEKNKKNFEETMKFFNINKKIEK